jgi:LemA protein
MEREWEVKRRDLIYGERARTNFREQEGTGKEEAGFDTLTQEGMALAIVAILVAFVVILLIWAVSIYNRLVGLRVLAENAWADIDVQLKRRYDLIPNLVETVKGYAAHERTTFEKVVQARAAAMSAQTPEARAQAENMLTGALKSLFALAENYPELKASTNFLELQGQLSAIEEAIQSARRTYNGVVREYNTGQQVFPASIIAGMFGFRPRQFFEVESAAERAVPKVQF